VTFDLEALAIIGALAILAPLLADVPSRIRLPVIVAEIGLGILFGPQVLNVLRTDDLIDFLSQLGLAFLFFLAGLEIDYAVIRGRPLRLAAWGWAASVVLALSLALAFERAGSVSWALGSFALTTTALGVLLPILRDSGDLGTAFGRFASAYGVVGEFGPIVAIAVVLEGSGHRLARVILLAVFVGVAALAGLVALRARPPRVVRLVEQTMQSSAQLAVRLCVGVLLALVFVAGEFGLDILLGAFAAGMIVGLVARGEPAEPVRSKIEGMGFGFFVPLFFVVTGINFDLDALLGSTKALIELPIFALLLLLIRGAPAAVLARRDLPRAELAPLALMTATGLPLIVAITSIGTEQGLMRAETAAALVGAGMLSVFVYPFLAFELRRRGPGARKLPRHEGAVEGEF
jgi:Kef-type K+ transport system membrane component KefB